MKTLLLVILIHSWYPEKCCADYHCHPTPCEAIWHLNGIYHWKNLDFASDKVFLTEDNNCHVCHDVTYPDGVPGNPRCLFVKGAV